MSTAPEQTNVLPLDAKRIETPLWNPDFSSLKKHIRKGTTLVISRSNRRGPANWLSTRCIRRDIDFLKYVCWHHLYLYRYWLVPTGHCQTISAVLPAGSCQITGMNFHSLQKQLPACKHERKGLKLVAVRANNGGYWHSTTLLNSSHAFDSIKPESGMRISFWIARLPEVVSVSVADVLEEKFYELAE